ncbi:MAG: caspase family protein, partial [Thermoanaerobaculia bacterium]
MKKVWLFVAAALLSCAQSIAAPKKLALLVGIDDYLAVTHLHGCVNDVRDMRNLLRTTYEFDDANILVLTDAQATHDGIVAKFRSHLINRAAAGDIVVFHYSGHGSRMPDLNGDELDDMDETIVPVDSRQGDIQDISDDELNALIRELQAKTKNITVILDSCNSGTAARADGIRQIPDDTRHLPARPNAPRGARGGVSDMKDLDLDYVFIAAARPKELANESLSAEGEERGALTYALTHALRAASEPLTVRELMEQVSTDVSAHFPSQHPQAEGLGIDKVVFGTVERPVTAHYLLSPSATGARVEGGVTSGLAAKAEFDVYPPRTRDFTTAPIARIRLTAVGPTESDAQVLSGTVQPLSRAVLRSNPFTLSPLRIYYDPAAGPIANRVKTDLAALQGFQEVQQDTSADLVLRKTPEGVAFHTPDLVQVSPAVSETAPGSPAWLVKQASDWARWFQILGIRNPAPEVTADATVRKVGSDATRDLVEGDDLEVIVRNTSNQDLYITIVDLSNDGSADPWYPPAGIQDQLPAGKELKRSFSMRVAPGRRTSIDTIKVFATTDWIDPNVFRLPPIKSAETVKARGNALESFIAASLQGARPGTPVEMKGWTTREATVTIRKNPVRLTNFIAHYEGAVAPPAASTRAALPDCAAAPNVACYDVRPFAPDGASVEIIPGGTRGGDNAVDSAKAWDEAYKIRDSVGAARVEPSLEYELDQFSPDIEGTRGGLHRPDKQKALDNNLWSLQHANVLEAWRLLQQSGRADGEEGKGILVGHPDTGYRKHPEIWNNDAALSPVAAASGWDYVRNNNDALDPLDNSGLLPNPGHGTKSSSVIISPKGQQLTDAAHPERFVDGVAP